MYSSTVVRFALLASVFQLVRYFIQARVLREYRSFPNLIFAMESFEESVLKVAKKSKVRIESACTTQYCLYLTKLVGCSELSLLLFETNVFHF